MEESPAGAPLRQIAQRMRGVTRFGKRRRENALDTEFTLADFDAMCYGKMGCGCYGNVMEDHSCGYDGHQFAEALGRMIWAFVAYPSTDRDSMDEALTVRATLADISEDFERELCGYEEHAHGPFTDIVRAFIRMVALEARFLGPAVTPENDAYKPRMPLPDGASSHPTRHGVPPYTEDPF
jgi:hypothetical protein